MFEFKSRFENNPIKWMLHAYWIISVFQVLPYELILNLFPEGSKFIFHNFYVSAREYVGFYETCAKYGNPRRNYEYLISFNDASVYVMYLDFCEKWI